MIRTVCRLAELLDQWIAKKNFFHIFKNAYLCDFGM